MKNVAFPKVSPNILYFYFVLRHRDISRKRYFLLFVKKCHLIVKKITGYLLLDSFNKVLLTCLEA